MKILYITTNFEALTHTFITREIQKVRQADNIVELLALRDIPQSGKALSPECDVNGCRYVYPVGIGKVLVSTITFLLCHPISFFRALYRATRDPDDSLGTKLKLGYQLMVATTLQGWVRQQGYDHIHAHFASPPTTFAMYLHFLTGVPYSFTGHAADIYRDRSALRPKISNANGVVCISEYNRRYYRELVPQIPPSVIVHCGIDLNSFSLRKKDHVGKPLSILAVGRCVAKKGFATLLAALAQLDSNGVQWQGKLAGDGPLLPDLKAQAKDLGISEKIKFLGSVPQATIKELIETTDVFVLPSVPVEDGDIDGIPVSLMEAMAMGCPVVSTIVSGIPELVSDGDSGLLVKPRDPKNLARAIRRLGEDPELYKRIAKNGRELVEDQFNLNLVGQQLTSFFGRIGN